MTMAFNPKQFKQKKKRVMDPNIVRPNLFSHEKKLKESAAAFAELQDRVHNQAQLIEKLRAKLEQIDSLVNIIGHSINNKK
jgi:cell fate (sporulation/competence/biofilm development) regulator YmcA (YheA/YmcA/DUF963 family)